MMWNPGQLPADWTMEQLLAKHSSQPANPDIANTLFRAGKIESWGRGIDLIRSTCLEEGYPSPRFSYDSTGLWIEFTFPKSSPENAAAGLGAGLGDGLGDSSQSRILRFIKEKPAISISELSKRLKISTTAVEKSLKRLKEKGLLKRIGLPKSGHWEA